jgi:hypothetical protein
VDDLFWDSDVWLEAMIHVTQCERQDCPLCMAIVEQCLKESASMEALLKDCA